MDDAAQSSSPLLRMGLMALLPAGIADQRRHGGKQDLASAAFSEMAGAIGRFAKAHLSLGLSVRQLLGRKRRIPDVSQAEIDKSGELKRFADGLGLTKKEMKELGLVTVTAGDAIRGLWKTISDGLGLESVFTSIKSFAVDAFKWIPRRESRGGYASMRDLWGHMRASRQSGRRSLP